MDNNHKGIRLHGDSRIFSELHSYMKDFIKREDERRRERMSRRHMEHSKEVTIKVTSPYMNQKPIDELIREYQKRHPKKESNVKGGCVDAE